jgi:hypothetical protein
MIIAHVTVGFHTGRLPPAGMWKTEDKGRTAATDRAGLGNKGECWSAIAEGRPGKRLPDILAAVAMPTGSGSTPVKHLVLSLCAAPLPLEIAREDMAATTQGCAARTQLLAFIK